MENPNEPKKSKFSEQPHYFQWGLTAFCVIGCCVLVAFVLIKLPFIWNVVKKLFGAPAGANIWRGDRHGFHG